MPVNGFGADLRGVGCLLFFRIDEIHGMFPLAKRPRPKTSAILNQIIHLIALLAGFLGARAMASPVRNPRIGRQ